MPNNRLYSLDILRGFAVILVLIRHVPFKHIENPQGMERVLVVLVNIGWTGVDLFFVLSGFLISGLLFKEISNTGAINFPRFWFRRGMKIWPSYFAAYGGMEVLRAASDIYTGKGVQLNFQALSNLIFIQNYFPAEVRWPHSWSIAIEEHFYFVLPLLLLFLLSKKGSLRSLPLIGVLVCIGVLFLRLVLAGVPGKEWHDFYYPTHLRADSLCFGVLLGYLNHYHTDSFRRLSRFWPVVFILLPLILGLAVIFPLEKTTSPFIYTVGFTLLYLVYGGLVIIAGTYPDLGKNVGWLTRFVAWVGVYSYTIYLMHAVIFKLPGVDRLPIFLRHTLVDSVWIDRCLFWILSIGTGYLLSRLIEQPFLEMRKKWLPSTRSTPEVPSKAGLGL